MGHGFCWLLVAVAGGWMLLGWFGIGGWTRAGWLGGFAEPYFFDVRCVGSLGGLMMRRLAKLQGVTVTNGMLLKQGMPPVISGLVSHLESKFSISSVAKF